MKSYPKYFLFTLLISSVIFCFSVQDSIGQSIELFEFPTEPVLFSSTEDIADIHCKVKNISTQPVKVWVTMDTTGCFSKHRAYFCWEQCYSYGITDPRKFSTGKPITIAAGKDTNAFKAYIDPTAIISEGIAGKSTLSFDFFNDDDPSDRVSASFTFIVGNASSIKEINSESINIVYNTVLDQLIYTGNASIKNAFLFTSSGIAIHLHTALSLHGISNGYYAYRIITEDNKILNGAILLHR
jgi:hypothetical protein